MSNSYYCLVAGLPDILLSDTKVKSPVASFKQQLKEELRESDYKLIDTFFWRFDNLNLLNKLENSKPDFNTLGTVSEAKLDEIIKVSKNDTLDEFENIPPYFETFLEAYWAEEALYENLSWENQLLQCYYTHLTELKNGFIADWYQTELDIQNLITAYNCKVHQLSKEEQVLDNNEISLQLLKSNARDFGLTSDFPALENILKALEDNNIMQTEKQLDAIRWNLLEDMVFFHYFSVERVFSFLLKLYWVERWVNLDKDYGRKMFKTLISELENTHEIPTEF